jgi:energy-coupling factor transporter transmembrane protein EcfT
VSERHSRSSERQRRSSELHLLRYIPTDSPLHRLWAGTKLVALFAFGVALSLEPNWRAEGILALTLIVAVLVARIPPGAAPRLPVWIWIGLGIGGFLSFLAGGSPEVHIGRTAIGFGALDQWARLTVLTVLLLMGSALVGWTTPLAELAPALSRLFSPLRRIRLPVDEIVIGVALSVRCLPLLVDELRILYAARRVRRPEVPEDVRSLFGEAVDLLVSALVAATRRAQEMGAAIEARGGLGSASRAGPRPRLVDWAVMLLAAAISAGMVLA